MTQPIKIGLIGFGLAGRVFHAPVIRNVPGLKLAAILQRSGDTAAAAYPDAQIVRTLDELLSTDIHLVVVATPNTSHYDIARRCLLAGRDVVVDKPFANSTREAADLLEVARREGRLVTAYQNRRWDGASQTVRQLICGGRLGRLVLFESHFDRYRPQLRPNAWRERAEPGSGILFDLGVHLIDEAVVLFGAPQSVQGDVRCERKGAADDAFDVTLQYPGMRVLLRATMLACEPGPQYVIRGERGTFVKHGVDPQEAALAAGGQPGSAHWGEEPPEQWGTLTIAEGENVRRERLPTLAGDYRKFYENVRDAMVSRVPLDVTPQQILTTLRIIELARESSERGCILPFTSVGASSGS